MIDKDSRSLKVLTDWNSKKYNCESQKQASLQVLINEALEEQDKLTRHACAEAVLALQDAYGGYPDRASINEISSACMNVKAL